MADSDGAAIMSEILYAFSKFARFLIDFGLVFVAESPIYYQNGKYYYPSDVPVGSQFPGGDFNPSKHFKRYKGLAALDVEDAKATFNSSICDSTVSIAVLNLLIKSSLNCFVALLYASSIAN